MNCLVGSLAVRRPSVDRSGERASVSSVRWMEDVASSVARPPARPIKRAIAVVASVFLLPNQHHHDATAFQNSDQFSSDPPGQKSCFNPKSTKFSISMFG